RQWPWHLPTMGGSPNQLEQDGQQPCHLGSSSGFLLRHKGKPSKTHRFRPRWCAFRLPCQLSVGLLELEVPVLRSFACFHEPRLHNADLRGLTHEQALLAECWLHEQEQHALR